MDVARLYGVDKEVEIFNETQLQEMLDAWEIRSLIPWMEKMEKAIICGKYEECVELMHVLRPHGLNTLPLQISKLASDLMSKIERNEPVYNLAESYLRLLRETKKFTTQFPFMTQDLIQQRVQFMEQYLGSPLNQNLIQESTCSCSLM